MLERLLGPKRCRVHDRELLDGKAVIQYGRVLIPKDFQEAAKKAFPHANSFVVMGRGGWDRKTEANVLYCPDCRETEVAWRRENPDWNRASSVFLTVQTNRRDLSNSTVKQMLRDSQLSDPEQVARYLWVVYRIGSEAVIAYNSEKKSYLFPFATAESPSYANVEALVEALNEKFEGRKTHQGDQ